MWSRIEKCLEEVAERWSHGVDLISTLDDPIRIHCESIDRATQHVYPQLSLPSHFPLLHHSTPSPLSPPPPSRTTIRAGNGYLQRAWGSRVCADRDRICERKKEARDLILRLSVEKKNRSETRRNKIGSRYFARVKNGVYSVQGNRVTGKRGKAEGAGGVIWRTLTVCYLVVR